MNVHIMIFIGFGFLMAFLRTHSWSAVGLNMIVSAWTMQWAILFGGFWN
jgi:ammonium transporter Rh